MTPVRRDEPRKPVIARGSPLPQLGDRCTNIVPIERGARRIDAVYISALAYMSSLWSGMNSNTQGRER